MPRPTSGTDVIIYETIDKVIPFFCDKKIHPNFVTFVGFALNIFIFKNNPSIFIALVILLLDFLDGEVARQCKKQSKVGAIFDSINDSVFDSILWLNILKIDVSFFNILIGSIIKLLIQCTYMDITDHMTLNDHFIIKTLLILIMHVQIH